MKKSGFNKVVYEISKIWMFCYVLKIFFDIIEVESVLGFIDVNILVLN